MTPEKALEHLAFKVKKFRNARDADAYNTLLDYYEQQNKISVLNHTMFAKMMVWFIKDRAMLKSWGMTSIMRFIEETLQTPLQYAIEDLKFNVPFFKFETIAHRGAEGLHPQRDYGKIKAIRTANMQSNKRELEQALRHEWTEEEAISFVEREVNKLVSKYVDKP